MMVVEVVDNGLYYNTNLVFRLEAVDSDNNYSNCSIDEWLLMVLIDLGVSTMVYT
jgi:hypothetical protein